MDLRWDRSRRPCPGCPSAACDSRVGASPADEVLRRENHSDSLKRL